MRFFSLFWLAIASWPATASQAATLGYSTFLKSYLNPRSDLLWTAPVTYISLGMPCSIPTRNKGSVFVAKLNPAATAYEYVTYFGTQYDVPTGIAADSAGNVYVTGTASSPSFPVTGTGYFGHAPVQRIALLGSSQNWTCAASFSTR